MYPSPMIPFILLLCTTPTLSTLMVNAPSSPQSATTTTITWTSNASDPVFSIELTHSSFNMAFAIANNVDPTLNQLVIELPLVRAGDQYTLEFVNITNISQIFAMSPDFSIAAAPAGVSSSSLTATISIVPSSAIAASTGMSLSMGGGNPSSAGIPSAVPSSPNSNSNAGTNAQTSAVAVPSPTLSQSASGATRIPVALGAYIIFGLVGVERWIL